ncbi:hypothetical protein BOX15_Mlig006914g1, partial [Macrostomum lignano]
ISMTKPPSQATPAPQQTQARRHALRPALRKSALTALAAVGRRAPRCLSQCVVRSLRENNRALAQERGCHLAEIAQLNQQVRQLQAENLRLQQQVTALKEGAGGQQQLLGGSLYELHSHNVRALDCLYRSVTASQKLLATVESEYERPLEASVATIGEQLSVLLTAYTDPFSQRDLIRRSPLRPLNFTSACSQQTAAAAAASSGPSAEASLFAAQPASKPEPSKPELPKPELPKPEPPKPELPKPELPKPEPPKPELPKPELPKPELPKPELPKPELPEQKPSKPGPPKQRRQEPQPEAKPQAAKSAVKRRNSAAKAAKEPPAEDPFSSRPRLTRTPPRPSSAAAGGAAAGRAKRGAAKRAPAPAASLAAAAASTAAPPKRRARREVVVDVKVESCAAGDDVFEPRSSVVDGAGLPPTLQGFRDGQQRQRPLRRGRRAAAK